MATETTSYTCISCPIGCPLQLEHEVDTIREVAGNNCDRGAKYARQEFTDPRRSFSTTIPIAGALHRRLPVRLSEPVPKDRILEAAQRIHLLSAEAPIRCGEVLLRDLLSIDGIDVVACRTMLPLE